MTRDQLRNHFVAFASICVVLGLASSPGAAQDRAAQNQATDNGLPSHHIKTVFIILMENHNWTGDGSLDIKANPAAPYI